MVFDTDTLQKLVIALVDCGEMAEYTNFAEFARTHYLKQIPNNLELLLWAFIAKREEFDDAGAIRLIEYVVRQFAEDSADIKQSVMNAYRILAFTKRKLKQPFFNDLSKYITAFEANDNFGMPPAESDLIDFVLGITYLRDRREYGGALRFANIIEKHFDASPAQLKPEFVAIFFLKAQAYEAKANKSEARLNASRVLDLLKTRDPLKTSGVLAVQQLELIKKESEAIIARASLIAPITSLKETLSSKVRVKVGRNDPCPCGSGKKYKRCCGK